MSRPLCTYDSSLFLPTWIHLGKFMKLDHIINQNSKFKTQGATYTFHKFNTMHKILTLFKTKSKLKLNQCYFLCLGFLLGYAKSWWWSQGGAAQVGSVRVVVVWNAILMFRYYFFEITHWSDEDTWETPFNVWHYAFRFLSCLTIFPLFFTSKSTNH
jgi:hypothetical protein